MLTKTLSLHQTDPNFHLLCPGWQEQHYKCMQRAHDSLTLTELYFKFRSRAQSFHRYQMRLAELQGNLFEMMHKASRVFFYLKWCNGAAIKTTKGAQHSLNEKVLDWVGAEYVVWDIAALHALLTFLFLIHMEEHGCTMKSNHHLHPPFKHSRKATTTRAFFLCSFASRSLTMMPCFCVTAVRKGGF